MTKTLDPKAAAEVIRKDWETEAGPLSPDDRRALTFLEEVCEHLGIEATPANAAHVGHLLSKHGIQQHDPAEYPKALNERDDRGRMVPAKYPHGHPCAGQDIVFADADEEEAWANWKPDADAGRHAGPAWDEWRAAEAKAAKAKAESKAADAKANQAKADADAGHAPQEAAKAARADADKAKAAAEAAQAKVDELKTKAQAAQAEADKAAAVKVKDDKTGKPDPLFPLKPGDEHGAGQVQPARQLNPGVLIDAK